MVSLGRGVTKAGRKFRTRISEILIFFLPLLFFTAILYFMVTWTIYVSFSNWEGVEPKYDFAGLRWYELMFSLSRTHIDVRNNLIWLIVGVLPTLFIALFLAYFLEIWGARKGESIIRTLILYPASMSFIVTGTIWSWMYQPDKGVINTLLRMLNLSILESRFITDPATANYWLILIFIWQYLGFAIIILQASFRTTELQEMVEAATIDGAGKLNTLFRIILPNIRGGILILLSLLLISALKVFDIVYIVTFGGPGYSTDVLAFFMYIATFQQHLVALGACLAVIIFVIAFILVIPYTLYALKRWFT
jgi:ABC-type sugar transport system permease subunit